MARLGVGVVLLALVCSTAGLDLITVVPAGPSFSKLGYSSFLGFTVLASLSSNSSQLFRVPSSAVSRPLLATATSGVASAFCIDSFGNRLIVATSSIGVPPVLTVYDVFDTTTVLWRVNLGAWGFLPSSAVRTLRTTADGTIYALDGAGARVIALPSNANGTVLAGVPTMASLIPAGAALSGMDLAYDGSMAIAWTGVNGTVSGLLQLLPNNSAFIRSIGSPAPVSIADSILSMSAVASGKLMSILTTTSMLMVQTQSWPDSAVIVSNSSMPQFCYKALSHVVVRDTFYVMCYASGIDHAPGVILRIIPATPASIALPAGTIPGGLEFLVARNSFLVSSAVGGGLSVVPRDNSRVPYGLPLSLASFGLRVDAPRNRVVVATCLQPQNASAPSQAAVAVLTLSDGSFQSQVDLTALGPSRSAKCAVDVAVDDGGDVYAIDRASQVVWRVGEDGISSVWASSPSAIGPPATAQLTAIDTEDTLVLVSCSGSGCLAPLFSIDRNRPFIVAPVKTDMGVSTLEGMRVYRAYGVVLALSRSKGKIFMLQSVDGWATATTVKYVYVPSACTSPSLPMLVNTDIFVTCAGTSIQRAYTITAGDQALFIPSLTSGAASLATSLPALLLAPLLLATLLLRW